MPYHLTGSVRMETATLTSRSQITVPKAVREALGIGPGDKFQFVPAWQGFRLVVVKGDITRMAGCFKGRRARPLTIEQMNAAIAESAVKRFERAAKPG